MLDVEVLSMAKVASWLELARAHLSMPFYFICLCCKKQEASTKKVYSTSSMGKSFIGFYSQAHIMTGNWRLLLSLL